MNKKSGSAQSRFCFIGSIRSKGYRWEHREQHEPAGGGDYIVPQGGVRVNFALTSSNGRTTKRIYEGAGARPEKRCFPMLELANAVQHEDQEKEAALEFVTKYGIPNAWEEIELQEFLKLGFKYLNFIQNPRLKSLTLDPAPRMAQHVDAEGNKFTEVKSLVGFCTLELAEMVSRGADFRQCDFCGKWYALERRSGSGRGRSANKELRFCNFGTNCRQKFAKRKC